MSFVDGVSRVNATFVDVVSRVSATVADVVSRVSATFGDDVSRVSATFVDVLNTGCDLQQSPTYHFKFDITIIHSTAPR